MSVSLDTLTDKLDSYLDTKQIKLVRDAYYFAADAHEGQKRRSGEAYVTHPLAVADILADMHMDHQSLAAAMLHDVIEDTGVDKAALGEQFGSTVAELVDGVSKLTQFEFRTHAEKQAENFQKMAMAMARDLRVILVKLADRLHNMRTLDVLSVEKRRRIAKETLEIYAPIANRLGMNDVRIEFEDLGFATLYPMRARRIKAAVASVRGHHKQLIDDIRTQLGDCLLKDGVHATVIGREKHLYSIYQKMRSKNISFTEIMDVFAFRIIVDSVDDCYRTLSTTFTSRGPEILKIILLFRKPMATSLCILCCLVCMACPSKYKFARQIWKKWLTMALQRIGFIKPMTVMPRWVVTCGRGSGCRVCWSFKRTPVIRLSLLKT